MSFKFSTFIIFACLTFFNFNDASEIFFADALYFPEQKTVSYIVTQNWSASGTLDSSNLLERCHSILEFDLSITKELSIGTYKFGHEFEVTMKRFSFSVETSEGVSAQYDSAQPKNNIPNKLQAIFDRNMMINYPIKFLAFGSFIFLDSDRHRKVLSNLSDQIYDSNSDVKNIYRSTNRLWFLKTTNIDSILSQLFMKPDSFIKKGDYYDIEVSPRMYLNLFSNQSSKMKPATSLTTEWVNDQNSNSLHFLLCIDQITSNTVEGSWQGDAQFKIRDLKSELLEENSSLSGTVAWDTKNALIQQRTMKWEGDVQSKLNSSQTTIHFNLDEVIQSKAF